MEQGFGPKLSRVAAGICFFLLLLLLNYVFGLGRLLVITLSFLLLLCLLSIALPENSLVKKIVGRASKLLDASILLDWLEDRFEFPKRS